MSVITDTLATYNPLSLDMMRWIRMTYMTYQSSRLPRIPYTTVLQQSGTISISDLDELGHCNNMRYLREAEFARIYFMMRSGLWSTLDKLRHSGTKVGFVLASSFVRYRKELLLGDQFITTCKILCWTNKSVLFEQTVVKNNRIHFYVIFQQAVVGTTAIELMSHLTTEQSLPMPKHVQQWLDSEITSKSHIPFSTDDVKQYLNGAETITPTVNSKL
jgi:acyl-CoA thioesterase FadM